MPSCPLRRILAESRPRARTLLAPGKLVRDEATRKHSPERIDRPAMPIAIKMPALSPTMEEGTLAKWLVKVGDKVSSGDIMAEIETDKATMEFEAVDEGTIADIAVAEGTEGVKVGTVIATLAEEGEDLTEAKAAGGAKQAEKPSPLEGRGLGEGDSAPPAAPAPAPSPSAGKPAPSSPPVGGEGSDRIIASPLA